MKLHNSPNSPVFWSSHALADYLKSFPDSVVVAGHVGDVVYSVDSVVFLTTFSSDGERHTCVRLGNTNLHDNNPVFNPR